VRRAYEWLQAEYEFVSREKGGVHEADGGHHRGKPEKGQDFAGELEFGAGGFVKIANTQHDAVHELEDQGEHDGDDADAEWLR